jgi:hypothetical protein
MLGNILKILVFIPFKARRIHDANVIQTNPCFKRKVESEIYDKQKGTDFKSVPFCSDIRNVSP